MIVLLLSFMGFVKGFVKGVYITCVVCRHLLCMHQMKFSHLPPSVYDTYKTNKTKALSNARYTNDDVLSCGMCRHLGFECAAWNILMFTQCVWYIHNEQKLKCWVMQDTPMMMLFCVMCRHLLWMHCMKFSYLPSVYDTYTIIKSFERCLIHLWCIVCRYRLWMH